MLCTLKCFFLGSSRDIGESGASACLLFSRKNITRPALPPQADTITRLAETDKTYRKLTMLFVTYTDRHCTFFHSIPYQRQPLIMCLGLSALTTARPVNESSVVHHLSPNFKVFRIDSPFFDKVNTMYSVFYCCVSCIVYQQNLELSSRSVCLSSFNAQ